MQLSSRYTLTSELGYDLLWKSAWFFSSKTQPRPNWSGFMQQVTYKGEVQKNQPLASS